MKAVLRQLGSVHEHEPHTAFSYVWALLYGHNNTRLPEWDMLTLRV